MDQQSLKRLTRELQQKAEGKVTKNLQLSKITTYKVGGSCDLHLMAESTDDVRLAIENCKKEKIPFFIIGKGSNVLAADEGFKGLIIQLGSEFKNIRESGGNIFCGSSVPLSKLLSVVLRYSLKGLSFASGIPGSVGGAVAGNAGAYGSHICDYVSHATVFTGKGLDSYEGDIIKKSGYRKGFLKEGDVLLEVVFTLEKGKHAEIDKEMKKYSSDRKKKHPQKEASCGSVFKNPPKISAASLIENAGWKGKTLGGAAVSKRHSNFIINKGSSSASDIYHLIKLIQSDVYYKSGVKLEPEVKFLGF